MPDPNRRLRIGLLAPEFPPMLGGMAELARGLAAALATGDDRSGRGDDVRVYTRPRHGLDAAPFAQHPVLTGLPARDRPRLAADEHEVDLWLALNAGLAPLARHLERPVFVYLHGNDFVNPWLPCAARWLEAVRRPYAAGPRHALRRRAVARAMARVRCSFTNSHQTAELARDVLGVAPERLEVVHPGVGDAFFQPHEPAGDDEGETLRLLTVSRLSRHTRRKNVDGVLRALARLAPRVAARYTVVGDGDDRPRLEALARDLGLAGRVRFTGAVGLDELLAAYRRADLFVLASKASERDVEGFGIVYLEAAAAGVPSICSREGGATDAVEDGRNGLLIDASTPEAVAAGIERFAAERDRFRPDDVRAFAERFRWPRVAARLRRHLIERLGRELVSRPGRA